MSRHCKFCTLVATIALLSCSCSDQDARTADREAISGSQTTTRVEQASTDTTAEAERSARLVALTERLDRARADRASLMVQRDSLATRLEAEQDKGRQLVAAIRSDLSEVRKQAGAEPSETERQRAVNALRRYEEDVRAQLEDTLAADEKLRGELDALDVLVGELESRIASMSKEIDALQANLKRQELSCAPGAEGSCARDRYR